MKKIILLFALVFNIGLMKGQTTFQKAYGGSDEEQIQTMHQTSDGGYIILSNTYSMSTSIFNAFLIKTNNNGDTIWTKSYKILGNIYGYDLKQTSDNGFILCGAMQYGAGAGNEDICLIKTNSNGDTTWTKTYSGTGQEFAYSVLQTLDGGYILTGFTNSFSASTIDAFIIKTNSTGNISWTKTLGGSGRKQGFSIQQTNDHGYIITGTIDTVGAGNGFVYLIKADSLGNILWTKAYGGIYGNNGYSVQQTSDGGYIIAGEVYVLQTSPSTVIDHIYIIKTDSNGNLMWSKKIADNANNTNDYALSIKQTTDNGYIITGFSNGFDVGTLYNSNAYLIKTDSNCTILWVKVYGGFGPDKGNTVEQTPDGGYIMAGTTTSFGTSSTQVYLVKTDSSGISGCNESNYITFDSLYSSTFSSPSQIISSPTFITNTISLIPNNYNTSVMNTCTVGILEQQYTPLISVYPNPSNGQFNFNGLEKENTIEIFDNTGQLIYHSISKNNFETIDISNKAKGIYFYRVTKEASLIQQGKIILVE